jgi:N-glycosylase/DNA lyase
MEELINKIESLKKSEISEVINKRINDFKNINKKSNNELFKEMCFCILTANFNAEKSIKIQNGIGNCFLTDTKDEIAQQLRNYGHRFPNTRAQYIFESKKCKDNLKDIIGKRNNWFQASDYWMDWGKRSKTPLSW